MSIRVRKLLLVALIHVNMVGHTQAFEMPKIFAGFQQKSAVSANPNSSLAKTKEVLLKTVSFTNNGKDASLETQKKILQLVSNLETVAPVSDTLLSDPEEAKALDGTWYLVYTSPSNIDAPEMDAWNPENSSEGTSKIDTTAYNIKGSVGAAGIVVDTSNRVTKQIFDIERKIVTNTVEQDWGLINVGGSFRASESVPNRAIVAFEKCQITLNNGFVIRLGLVFALLAFLRGGIKDSGWLETTYLDSEVRIGRGNKGTLFVLTRDRNALQL